jgi:hypothetical protein
MTHATTSLLFITTLTELKAMSALAKIGPESAPQ